MLSEAIFFIANILFLCSKVILLNGEEVKKITVYEKPTCTTCRKTVNILIEMGVDFEKVNYYLKPFSKAKLKSILIKMNMKPSELLRKNEDAYKKLKGIIKTLSQEEILELMIKNPDLVQRPIVEIGDEAILARPAEKIKELF
jgi:arsenate reductase